MDFVVATCHLCRFPPGFAGGVCLTDLHHSSSNYLNAFASCICVLIANSNLKLVEGEGKVVSAKVEVKHSS